MISTTEGFGTQAVILADLIKTIALGLPNEEDQGRWFYFDQGIGSLEARVSVVRMSILPHQIKPRFISFIEDD
ncbi:MAG: hypothetical protein WAV55_03950 [Clostridiaceae bacterium]